jgi:hypothetical protein
MSCRINHLLEGGRNAGTVKVVDKVPRIEIDDAKQLRLVESK